MVDKQIDMLSAALAKKPKAHRLRRAGQQGGDPAAEEGAGRQDPGRRLRLRRRQRHPGDHRDDRQLAAAALAADKMAELIGDAGEVALVVHDQTSRTGIDRRDGFVEPDQGRAYPNIKIVERRSMAAATS